MLIRNSGLVKTVQFANEKYVGDPLNAVRIFNEKEVDEIIVLDIDATSRCAEPNYALIGKIANECRMPLCYGGGIKSASSAERIISLGVEKIALSSAAFNNPEMIELTARSLGSQSVAVVIDVRKSMLRGYEIFTHNGARKVDGSLADLIGRLENLGAGEIIVNSIDRDGTMKGYDLKLAATVRELSHRPLTMIGGVGTLSDVKELINTCGIVGCGAGSYFVFKGKYRAVLISYPSREDKLGAFGLETRPV